MFKLVVLFAFIAIAAGRPGYLPSYENQLVYSAPLVHQEYVNVHEPVVTNVGSIVESIPSAVSHQSQTVVHGSKTHITPVLAHGVQSYSVPIVKTYAASPFVYSNPYSGYYGHHGW